MQASLNFGKLEKEKVKKVLGKFEKKETKASFEELRIKINDCTVTLYNSGRVSIQGKNAEKVKEEILKEMNLGKEIILGIDETGRGEDFGPLVIAGVLGDNNKLRELRDSKKVNKKSLKEKFEIVKEKAIGLHSVEVKASEIDERRKNGENLNEIQAKAINEIIKYFLKKGMSKSSRIVVDGASIKGVSEKAEFLPKADDLVPVVGAASIIAKFERNNSKDREERKSWKKKNEKKY